MKNNIILFLGLFLISTATVFAQSETISPARKQAIDSLALEKVRI